MQSLSLTSVSPVPSLKPWKDKQDSRDGLIKSSRAAVKPFLFSILLGGLDAMRRDNRLNGLSVLKEERLCLESWRLSLSHAWAKLLHPELP